MRFAKGVLFGLVVFGLWSMWHWRTLVTDAYTDPEAQTEIRLTGVDLDVTLADLGPSPYVAGSAPDTRRSVPPVLAFAADEEQEPPPVAMTGGTATIGGTVTYPAMPSRAADPDPPEPNAPSADPTDPADPAAVATPSTAAPQPAPSPVGVVRLERHTSEGIGIREIALPADGRWSVSDLPGGRYRVRAWVPNRYTSDDVSVFFLDAGSTATVNVDLSAPSAALQVGLVTSGTVYEGLTGSVAVTVSQQRVDDQGVLVTSPVAGVPFTVTSSGIYSIDGSPVRTTDSRGAIVYRLRCDRTGSASMLANFGSGGQPIAFALPDCVPVPPPPTPEPTPADPGSSEPATPDSGASSGGSGAGNAPPQGADSSSPTTAGGGA